MTMTPEQIYRNFTEGTSDPLKLAAQEMRAAAEEYGDLMATFGALQNQLPAAWSGSAAGVASDKASQLWESLSTSEQLLESCAQSYDAQTSAFQHAKKTVVPIPPEPVKPDVLEMIKVSFGEGPHAPFERAADFQEAKQARAAAEKINNDAYMKYSWATADNTVASVYPEPHLDGVPWDDTMTATSTEDRPRGPEGPFPPVGPFPPGSERPPGGGVPPGGGPGGGIGDPGPPDVPPLTSDPSGPGPSLLDDPPGPPPDGPPGDWPPGGTTPNDAGPPVVQNPPPPTSDPDGPPPPRNPPPVVPPVGGGVPGPGGRDPSRNDSGDQAGVTHAAGAGAGANMSPLGMPLGGVGDRAGADQLGSGSQAGRGAGGPGGGQAVPGSFGGGGRGGGAGGFGGMMPPGSANREEDKEHQRPEYLIEPDPAELFGSDQSTSSPVIGATWKPEQYDDDKD